MSEQDLKHHDDDENENDSELDEEDEQIEFCYGPETPDRKSHPFITLRDDEGSLTFPVAKIKRIPRANLGIIDFYPDIKLSKEINLRTGNELVTVDHDRDNDPIGLTVQEFSTMLAALSSLQLQLEPRTGERKRLTREYGKQLAKQGGSKVDSLTGSKDITDTAANHSEVENRRN